MSAKFCRVVHGLGSKVEVDVMSSGAIFVETCLDSASGIVTDLTPAAARRLAFALSAAAIHSERVMGLRQ